MIQFDVHERTSAERDDGLTIILLHGRGADETDLAGLRPLLPAHWTLVLPRAPFPSGPWGYGSGWAWYRYLGENRPEPESYSQSLVEIAALLADTPAITGAPLNRVLLGGFSQGGTVSLGYSLAGKAGELAEKSHAGAGSATLTAPVPGLIANMSGFLPDHPLVHADARSVADTRFYWAHGRADPAIPFAMAVEGRASLRRAGADLVTVDEPGGHWIERSTVDALVAWASSPSRS